MKLRKIYTYQIDSLKLTTGDIVCTRTGSSSSWFGWLSKIGGLGIPGDVDHVAVYVGPGGMCVEAGLFGVINFKVSGNRWNEDAMFEQRKLLDTLVGAVSYFPTNGRSKSEVQKMRRKVAEFCLKQAKDKKPYNPIFFIPYIDTAYYCSQLVYKAYQAVGIALPKTAGVVLPVQIWKCAPVRQSAK